MSEVEALQARVDALEAEVARLRDSEPPPKEYRRLADFRGRKEKLEFIQEHGLDAYLDIINRSTGR